MGRPATPIGEHGLISYHDIETAKGWVIEARAYVRDSDGVTRPVRARGRTKAIAQSGVLAKLGKRGSRYRGGNVQPRTTIGDLADIYVRSLPANNRLKLQTKARYAQSAEHAIKRAFPEVAVRELTPGMVERFIMALANDGHVSEARNCRVVLRAMMRLAIADDAITQNPVAAADVRLPVSAKTARALTVEELRRLRNMVATYRSGEHVHGPKQSPDLMEALDTMLGTGLRISEVLALRDEDVIYLDDGRATVSVEGTIIYADGVGATRQNTTKNGKARSVTVAPWVAAILNDRAALTRSGLLWETRRTAKPYQQQNLLRDLRSIVADSELAWVTSHSLRKTAGTFIAQTLGVSVATSALGHSSDDITRRIYIDQTQLATDLSGAMDHLAPLRTPRSA